MYNVWMIFMNNKMIFYSVLFVFSSIAVASEQPSSDSDIYKVMNPMVVAHVVSNKGTIIEARNALSQHATTPYKVIGSYTSEIEDHLAKYIINKQPQCLSMINVEKRDDYINIIDYKTNSVINFDKENKDKLIPRIESLYSVYKMHNNGWLYNSCVPFHIHLVDNLTGPCKGRELGVDNTISLELHPQHVEKIIGSNYSRNWNIAKIASFLIIIAVLAKNYSQLMQMINGR